MKKRRGQVTIFVIIAVVIIAAALLIYFLVPGVNNIFSTSSENPYQFIQSCLEDDLVDNIITLSDKGGSLQPEHYILYNGETIEYLCYTNEYYRTCVMQQPMLKKHIEEELKVKLNQKIRDCFTGLEQTFKEKGYRTTLNTGDYGVELLPKRVIIEFNHSLALTKDDTENYDKFSVVINNNLYELVSIANSILNWEARYGDAETTSYMNYYHDLKVEKKKQSDGSTIYILTDRNTQDKFQFATRSVAWPPGI